MTTEARRPTRQRRAVAAVLESVDDFRSAQEIYELLRERGENVGLTTVYRTLQLLHEEERVDTLRNDEGESLYRTCSAGHHHHLVCRACGRTVEVSGPTVERWATRVADDHGYRDVRHTLEIFGTCPDCT